MHLLFCYSLLFRCTETVLLIYICKPVNEEITAFVVTNCICSTSGLKCDDDDDDKQCCCWSRVADKTCSYWRDILRSCFVIWQNRSRISIIVIQVTKSYFATTVTSDKDKVSPNDSNNERQPPPLDAKSCKIIVITVHRVHAQKRYVIIT